jgi:TolA-binding protein
MKRGARWLTAFASLLVVALPATPAAALEEPDRLWLVGERAFADGLHTLARRTLEKLVEAHARDPRVPQAIFLLGQIRLAGGDAAGALAAFRRAQTFDPPPGRPREAKFWEAEALFRLKRFAEASVAYDEVVRNDALAPFAPDAVYGYGWSELELKRPEVATKAFRDFLGAWPDHALAPSASYHLARSLVAQHRYEEAVQILQAFLGKHATHKLAPDALYLRGWARVAAGDTKAGVADLRAFSEANPAHPDASSARRLIVETVVQHGGDSQDLIEAYRVLMAQSPASPEGLFDAAGIAGRLGRTRDQELAWRKLRTTFPEHALSRRVALELSAAAYKRKDWRETVAQAQPATLADDEAVRGEAFLLLGEGELKLRRFAGAAKAFDSALDITSLDDALRYRALAGLGLAREELRDFREAMSAYDQVANNSPDPALREWAQERFNAVKGRLSKPPEKKSPGDKKVRTGS